MLAKFKVVEKDSILTPLSKVETGHMLDMSGLSKAALKSGFLALIGKDGFISFHSGSMEASKDSGKMLHFFHHDTGGVIQADFSNNGCILAVNGQGSLLMFQPRQNQNKELLTSSQSGTIYNCIQIIVIEGPEIYRHPECLKFSDRFVFSVMVMF